MVAHHYTFGLLMGGMAYEAQGLRLLPKLMKMLSEWSIRSFVVLGLVTVSQLWRRCQILVPVFSDPDIILDPHTSNVPEALKDVLIDILA